MIYQYSRDSDDLYGPVYFYVLCIFMFVFNNKNDGPFLKFHYIISTIWYVLHEPYHNMIVKERTLKRAVICIAEPSTSQH